MIIPFNTAAPQTNAVEPFGLPDLDDAELAQLQEEMDQDDVGDIGLDDKQCLARVNDAWESQRDSLIGLHRQQTFDVAFVHGYQDHNVDMATGELFRSTRMGDGSRTYNATRKTIENMKSMFGRIPQAFEARPMSGDNKDVEGSKVATDLIEFIKVQKDIARFEQRNLDVKMKAGESVVFVGWDPAAGSLVPDEETGEPRPTGDLILELLPSQQVIWDPRASHYTEALWAIRRSSQTEEYVRSRYGKKARNLDFRGNQSTMGGSDYYERAMRFAAFTEGAHGPRLPKGMGEVTLYEYYYAPNALFPDGMIIVCAGDSSGPTTVLHAGPNVYGRIPFVLFGFYMRPFSLHYESIVRDLRDPQIDFNIGTRQVSKNCDRMANSWWVVPHGSTPNNQITNGVDKIIRYPDGSTPPQQVGAPPLPPQVFERLNRALQMIDILGSPAGPTSLSPENQGSSGIHRAEIEAAQRAQLSQYVIDHIACWEDVYTYCVDMYRRFGGENLSIVWLGSDNEPRKRIFSDWMLTNNLKIKFVADDPLPETKMSTFARVQENIKSGGLNMLDPYEKQKANEAMGLGHLVRFQRDGKLDLERAQRNLLRAQVDRELPVPSPEVQDNLDIHLAKYLDFMKTAEWDEMSRVDPFTGQMADPVGVQRVRDMVMLFQLAKQFQLQQMTQMMAHGAALGMQQAEADGGGNVAQERQVGGHSAKQGPKMTQGHSPGSAFKNRGGRPVGS